MTLPRQEQNVVVPTPPNHEVMDLGGARVPLLNAEVGAWQIGTSPFFSVSSILE